MQPCDMWPPRQLTAAVALVLLLLAPTCCLAIKLVPGTPTITTSLTNDVKRVVVLYNSVTDLTSDNRPAPGGSYRLMTDSTGMRRMCHIPPPQDPADAAPSEVSQDTRTSVPSPSDLLDKMTALCLYRQERDWTYEYCHKQACRQFRQEVQTGGQPRKEEFVLGLWADVQSDDVQTDSFGYHFIRHNLTGGAPCILTGAPRSAEVRFMCARDTTDNLILSVKEMPACHYVFTVTTPYLCKHPPFKPPPEPARTITCIPADAPTSFVDGQKRLAELQEAAVKQEQHKDSSDAVNDVGSDSSGSTDTNGSEVPSTTSGLDSSANGSHGTDSAGNEAGQCSNNPADVVQADTDANPIDREHKLE